MTAIAKLVLVASSMLVAPAAVATAMFCGFAAGGGGGSGASDNRATCSWYVAASGGSDSNAGTSLSPFSTLSHLQTVLQGSSGKVGCLKAGTYTSASISLSSSDSNETWETDTASPVNSAILDGGNSIATAVSGTSATGVTFNGLKFQNYTTYEILGGNTDTGWTIENSDLGLGGKGGGVGVGGSNVIAAASHWTIMYNYVHDWQNGGITYWAFNNGDSVDGTVISSNVVLNVCTVENDCGAIYGNMRNNPPGGGTVSHVTVSGNFVRDYGSAINQTAAHCLYLDDDTSNVTMTGNICGPPASGDTTGNNTDIIFNGGDGNVVSNNVLDQGLTAIVPLISMGPCGTGGSISCSGPTAPSSISKNIVVMRFSGNFAGNVFGNGGAFPWTSYYCTAASSGFPGTLAQWISTFSTNMYHNYAGGQSSGVFGSTACGTLLMETTPQQTDPLCSGYLYNLAGTSPALGSPMSFQDVVAARSAGPPGFVIPTSSNHSC
jgi:hypothetical protein